MSLNDLLVKVGKLQSDLLLVLIQDVECHPRVGAFFAKRVESGSVDCDLVEFLLL